MRFLPVIFFYPEIKNIPAWSVFLICLSMFPGDVVIIEWLASGMLLALVWSCFGNPYFKAKESDVGHAKHLTDGKWYKELFQREFKNILMTFLPPSSFLSSPLSLARLSYWMMQWKLWILRWEFWNRREDISWGERLFWAQDWRSCWVKGLLMCENRIASRALEQQGARKCDRFLL